MTLAKALKYKKRVAERIAKISESIQQNNSFIVGSEREVDIRALLDERAKLVKHMVDLKLAIDAANAPIKRTILAMSEMKGDIAFYNVINTRHGISPSAYREEKEHTYEAVIRRSDVDTAVRTLERAIDAEQEHLERHNHLTTIDITPLV